MPPIVSVVMPVYNGEKYLNEALNSILSQTLTDLELIVINDSSTDLSHIILEEFAHHDARIHFYNNENNLGLPTTLIRGLELARGEYIARMDQDDISSPERLEKQVQYMQTHLEIDICGCWAEIMGDRTGEIWKYPTGHDEIFAKMLFNNTLIHPSVMMRSSALQQFGLSYDGSATHFEDYDLWSRALPLMRFANIPEPLLQYRLHGANTGDLHADKQLEGRALIYKRFFSLLELEYSKDDLALHEMLSSNKYNTSLLFLQDIRRWLEKIAAANVQAGLISSRALNVELGSRWTRACQLSNSPALPLCIEILSSPLLFRESTGLLKLLRVIKFFLSKTVFVKIRGLCRK